MAAAGMVLLATAIVILATGQGCADQATPSIMPDGAHNITKSMRGFWDSPGAKGCAWRKLDRFGHVTAKGGGARSQTVLISTADVGGKFRSDKCKRWSPK